MLDAPRGVTGNTATASLSVADLLAKSFGAPAININGVTSLTFTLLNPTFAPLTGIAFTDALPVGLAIVLVKPIDNQCNGIATAVEGSRFISLAGAQLGPRASCTLSLNVVGVGAGVQSNTTSTVTTLEGLIGAPATATIQVLPAKEPVLPPVLSKTFGAASIAANLVTTLTFTMANPNVFYPLSGIAFTDPLPPGLAIAIQNGLVNNCGGAVAAPGGSTSIDLSGVSLARSASCTLTLSIAAIGAGQFTNTTSAVTSVESGAGLPAIAAITVVPFVAPVVPPVLTEMFGADTVDKDAATTLTFTVTNPNAVALLTGIGFTDTLPAGLVVATPNGLTNGCGGSATAAIGTRTITLAGVGVGPGASCTLTLNAMGVSGGPQTNTTSGITSVEGGVGAPATATIAVREIIESEAIQVRYVANIPIGDSVINITNTGTLTLPGGLFALTCMSSMRPKSCWAAARVW